MLRKLISSLSLIFESAKKERKLIFKDDATVEIYIVFVALVYVFYTFVYSPEVFTKMPVAIVDKDQTTISQQVKRMLNDTESLNLLYEVNSMEEAKKLFEEEKVNGIVVIPENFSQKLQKAGDQPAIAIYCDASYMLYYDKALVAVTDALGAFTGELQLKQTMMSGVPMKQAVASSKPFNIIATPLYNIDEGYATFIIPMVLIIALQTLQLTGMGVLFGTMREQNTFVTNFAMAKRSRFGYFFLTLGRSLPYLLISMVLLLFGILFVFHVFTIPQRGNLWEIIVFLIPVVLAITFLGMTLMNIFRNREDTIMLLTVFSIPTLMMGGVSYPIVAFPMWIKVLGFFFPSTIGVKGFLALSQAGASLNEIKDIFLQMWLICLFYFILAVWTNRRFLYQLVPAKIPSIPSVEPIEDELIPAPITEQRLTKEASTEILEEENLLEDVPSEYLQLSDDSVTTDLSMNEDETANKEQDQTEAVKEIAHQNNDRPIPLVNPMVELVPEKEQPTSPVEQLHVTPEVATIKDTPKVASYTDLENRIVKLLEPLSGFVMHYATVKDSIIKQLTRKLSLINEEALQAPKANIAVPAIKALSYNLDSRILSNLYINLLANAMDKSSSLLVHPSFVATIKQLSEDEAQLLTGFVHNPNVPYVDVIQIAERASSAMNTVLEKHVHLVEDHDLELDNIDYTDFYLENMGRLGLINIKEEELADTKVYQKLETCCLVRNLKKEIEHKGFEFETQRGYFTTSIYGAAFVKTVIKNK